ncbi:hypothetical protein DLJ53_05710 [Acuticoccus sediminis]|uniref:Uncharacterized protein n=2 Tax=Acuticoccus sediminis TaxID=2184697 RepID=A0A8B2NX66_9HYPH|nr:hypothetical protein DLJ53_05710 [Acuticoccus sediminis]
MTAISLTAVSTTAMAGDDAWTSAAIADALTAAPPSVTHDATIFGWSDGGKLTLARYGSGPYTCIASGAFSLRLGKPALPYPDPMCLDQNAWAFLSAIWSGKAKDGGTLPTAPGLVWMLAGMNVSKTAVDVGAATFVATSGTQSNQAGGDVVQMSPHVMVMPLPLNEGAAELTTSYSLEDPIRPWIMAAGLPHEHLMVHFTDKNTQALMNPGE